MPDPLTTPTSIMPTQNTRVGEVDMLDTGIEVENAANRDGRDRTAKSSSGAMVPETMSAITDEDDDGDDEL